MALVDRFEKDVPKFYRRPHDILRDRRFNDEERLRLLNAWSARDDYERGEIEMAKQEIAARTG